MKFKVGQKIRMVRNESEAQVGDTGIIQALPCSSSPTYDSYAVEFPCFAGNDCGHNCHGLVPSNNGHWISENQMELASEQDDPIIPQDFPEITQVTVIGEPKSNCVIEMRAKVTKNENGYTIEKLAEPKFTVGEQFATASGKLGKVTKVNPEGNYCVQWFNGKYCSAQPEDTMHKIVWGN